MLGEIVMTFVPSVAFTVVGVLAVAASVWVRRRRARPGYAPLWAWAYVLAIVAGLTVCGVTLMANGRLRQAFTGSGRHRRPREARAQ
jgi:hypothetical protein